MSYDRRSGSGGGAALTLTAGEIEEYTGREKPAWQARVLRALGVPFAVHPFDGTLLVDREAARAALGVKLANADAQPAEINLTALEALPRGRQRKARAA